MGSRYVLGWAAVLALAVGASGGTLVLVRQAIGEGRLADPLSQAQVRSQYERALHPTSGVTTRPGSTSPNPSASTPTTTPSGPTSQPPAASSTGPSGHHSSSTSSGSSTQSHPSGSSTTHTSPPPPSSVTRVLTSPGGSVVVRCTTAGGGSGQVYLVSWSPAQGYAVDHAERGPGEEAEIEFASDHSAVSVTYHCTSSGPVQEVESGDGNGGGDDGAGGGDG